MKVRSQQQSDGQRSGIEDQEALELTVISFGYKEGLPPPAHMLFDVRFLKNPFWVPELRPLTGLDQPVRDYVLSQPLAEQLLESLIGLLMETLPRFRELELKQFVVAFGCTGGQHRSTALAEALAAGISQRLPGVSIKRIHRELAPPAGSQADSVSAGDCLTSPEDCASNAGDVQ